MKPTRLAVSLLFALAANAAAQSTPDLTGLWGATLRFGPDTHGPLIIYRTPDEWRADIAGFTVPVRGAGWFTRAKRIDVNGTDVRLIGPSGRGPGPDTTLVQGHYENGVITLPLRGGTYDFTRIGSISDTASSPFYPRGNPPARYRYAAPLQLDDAWPVATLEDVGISRPAIEQFVQMLIDMPMDSLNTLQIHSLLIARHGKLVLEEYFHGASRDQPHNLRSASKSWTATLIGAAMHAGVPLRLDTPVYRTMLGTVPADLDPRKRAMTLEHLLTMTAGFNCDEDDSTSANEDVMDSRGIEHWWDYTLNVALVSAPGDKMFYCSTEAHLAGGLLAKVARTPQLELFDRLLARPMRMRNYYLGLRDGDAYGGGGAPLSSPGLPQHPPPMGENRPPERRAAR